MARYVVGVDFGTLSGRAVVVDVADGAERGSAVHAYRHGVITERLPGGPPLPPDWALQDPTDHATSCGWPCPPPSAWRGSTRPT